MKCPGDLELARSIGTGALDEHLAQCAGCRDEHAGFTDAIALARELSVDMPSPARRADMRAAVLAAGSFHRLDLRKPRSPRRYLIAASAAGALAAAAVALVVIDREPPPAPSAHSHASVTARPGARYAALSTMPDEVIRLDDGTIAVEVAALHHGERFIVRVGASEIEVRGTAFEVTAAAGQLVSVVVTHGRVEVRPDRGAPTLLGIGQAWRASTQVGPSPTLGHEPIAERAPVVVPARRPSKPTPRLTEQTSTPAPDLAGSAAPPTPAPIAPRSHGEIAYDDAWAAMRSQNFARAATAFSRALILEPDGAIAEDAAFWLAVALARAQRSNQAITAFRDFIAAHPKAARAGEASAMLGWLLVEAGDRVEAARRFRAAEHDTNDAVRKSARAGLDALAR